MKIVLAFVAGFIVHLIIQELIRCFDRPVTGKRYDGIEKLG